MNFLNLAYSLKKCDFACIHSPYFSEFYSRNFFFRPVLIKVESKLTLFKWYLMIWLEEEKKLTPGAAELYGVHRNHNGAYGPRRRFSPTRVLFWDSNKLIFQCSLCLFFYYLFTHLDVREKQWLFLKRQTLKIL